LRRYCVRPEWPHGAVEGYKWACKLGHLFLALRCEQCGRNEHIFDDLAFHNHCRSTQCANTCLTYHCRAPSREQSYIPLGFSEWGNVLTVAGVNRFKLRRYCVRPEWPHGAVEGYKWACKLSYLFLACKCEQCGRNEHIFDDLAFHNHCRSTQCANTCLT